MTVHLHIQPESARTNAVDLARESISNGERVDFFCDHCDVERHANFDPICTEVGGHLFSIQAGEGVDRLVRLTCDTAKKYLHQDCFENLEGASGSSCLFCGNPSHFNALGIDVTVFNSSKQLIDIFAQIEEGGSLSEDTWNDIFTLLDAGAGSRPIDNNERSLLHHAVASGRQERVEELLDRCSIERLARHDENERTPLHYAAQLEDPGILTYLLAFEQLNPNGTDKDGKTPLHLAVHARNLEMVAAMTLNPRVNLELTDNDGKPPIQYAREEGSAEIRSLLEAAIQARKPSGFIAKKKSKKGKDAPAAGAEHR